MFNFLNRKGDKNKRTDDLVFSNRPPINKNADLLTLDRGVIWITIALLCFGLVMVYSASIAISQARPFHYVGRQFIFILLGCLLGLMVFRIEMNTWRKYAPSLFKLGLILLIAVLIPGVGRDVNGARRWISLVVVNFQPSEVMKIFVILYASDYTVRKLECMSQIWRVFIPMFIAIVLVGGLLLNEPDFGAFVVIVAIAFGILFLGGMNVRAIVILAICALVALTLLVIFSPYRRDRLFGFMNPWQDPLGKGYQLSHSLMAFGRGGWLGEGLGASVEKQFYLPEAHTDFILAVIAEELGFVGIVVVISLFMLLVLRAFTIGKNAISLGYYFSALVAMGIGIWIGVQSIIIIGVNMGVLPTKGLTVPFMSFGGSSIVVNCIGIALLLRVDWENHLARPGWSK